MIQKRGVDNRGEKRGEGGREEVRRKGKIERGLAKVREAERSQAL